MRSITQVLCLVVLSSLVMSNARAVQYLPVMDDTSLRCDQGNNECDPTHCPSGALAYAWDFSLNGTSGDADLGLPILAAEDGIVRYAQDYASGSDDRWGKCVVVWNGTSGILYAHLHEIHVGINEPVKAGQVIGLLGDADNQYAAHIHVQRQSGTTPNAQSISSSFTDVGNPTSGVVAVSQNDFTFDRAEVEYGSYIQNLGGRNGEPHLWYAWQAGQTNNCYIQGYQGTPWPGAVVYDALNGASKSYPVVKGFWDHWRTNGDGNDADGDNGPRSDFGMPITPEYQNGAYTRQDGTKKYYLYRQNANPEVTVNDYPTGYAPGAFANGWHDHISYLFALAYERNGARNTVGEAQGSVYNYGPYLRQDFSGGTFGDCCILYDPNNAVENPAATNEAYLLRTGFYAFYEAHGGSALGCPSRDEYLSRDPEHWDEPTEYPLQNFFDVSDAQGEQHHYMIWRNGEVTYHSNYTTAYVSQNPAGQFSMGQGDTRTFTVQFRNTGSNTWYNTPIGHLDAYVELKSCDSGGLVMGSFLNNPYDPGLGWLNLESPCTMQESSVAPNAVATFQFVGRIPSNAAPGLYRVYFRPNHSTAGLMQDWGGMHYVLDVQAGSVDSSFEVDVAPADDIPDGWTVLNFNGAGYTYGSGGAAHGNRYVAFTHTASNHWNAIGTSAESMIAPNIWYRVRFSYRTTNGGSFGWRLGAADMGSGSLPIGAEVLSPLTDGQWHQFWSAPFQVSQAQLDVFPNLAFYYDYDRIGTVAIDLVAVEPSVPCQ